MLLAANSNERAWRKEDGASPPTCGGAAETRRTREAFTNILIASRETKRLWLFFLGPLVLAVLATITALIAATHYGEWRDSGLGVVRLRTSVATLYNARLEEQGRALHTIMDVLSRDQSLQAALAQADRNALLIRAAPIFEDIRRHFDITHLYFTQPDRMNLLRVHQPQRHGDVIDRVTTLMAERSGAIARGVELGPLGTFTLRLVSPWYDQGTKKLLGYVELGMEIGRVLDDLQRLFGVDLVIVIKKELLDRSAWEDGMRALGRTPDWDAYRDFVIAFKTLPQVPSNLGIAPAGLLSSGPTLHRTLRVPLFEVADRNVGEMVLYVDPSPELGTVRFAILLGAFASALAGSALVLLVIVFWLVRRVGRRIQGDKEALRDLAVHDGLSGLLNHRMCYLALEAEIAKAGRQGSPLSLLMLDIDHFKRINDVYGHLAGDRVIKDLAGMVQRSLRQGDSAYRYGGEEISVIVPQTRIESAVELADRLRAAVEQATFSASYGEDIKITVSIGVAAFPQHAASPQDLIHAADAAMYAAKSAGRNRVQRYDETTEAAAPALAPA